MRLGMGADTEPSIGGAVGAAIGPSGCFAGRVVILLGCGLGGSGAGVGRLGTRVGESRAGIRRRSPKNEIR